MSLFHRDRRSDDGNDRNAEHAPRSPRETMRLTERERERSLNEQCEFQVRRVCWRCEGRCTDGPPVVTCVVCQTRYTAEQLRGREWRYMLPCGHALPASERHYRPLRCEECHGDGELYAWITLGDWLGWLAAQYPDGDAEDGDTDVSLRTTRRRRVV